MMKLYLKYFILFALFFSFPGISFAKDPIKMKDPSCFPTYSSWLHYCNVSSESGKASCRKIKDANKKKNCYSSVLLNLTLCKDEAKDWYVQCVEEKNPNAHVIGVHPLQGNVR